MSLHQLRPLEHIGFTWADNSSGQAVEGTASPKTPSKAVVTELKEMALKLLNRLENYDSIKQAFIKEIDDVNSLLEEYHEAALEKLSLGAIDMTLINGAKVDLDLLYQKVQLLLKDLVVWDSRYQALNQPVSHRAMIQQLIALKNQLCEDSRRPETAMGQFCLSRIELAEKIIARDKIFAHADLEIPRGDLMQEAYSLERVRSYSYEMSASIGCASFVSFVPKQQVLDLGPFGELKGTWSEIKQDLDQLRAFYKELESISKSYVDIASGLITQFSAKLRLD